MPNVVPIRPIRWENLRPDEAERIIREWSSKKTDRVQFTKHAGLDRARERDISSQDALEILRRGHVTESPKKNEYGDWEVKMEKRMAAGREACAVTIIIRNNEMLIVNTVMWKDGS